MLKRKSKNKYLINLEAIHKNVLAHESWVQMSFNVKKTVRTFRETAPLGHYSIIQTADHSEPSMRLNI